MSQQLPTPPIKAPLTDGKGIVSIAWTRWFQTAYVRMGQASALSNSELSSSTIGSLTVINAEIVALQTSVASLQNNGPDFNVGTVL